MYPRVLVTYYVGKRGGLFTEPPFTDGRTDPLIGMRDRIQHVPVGTTMRPPACFTTFPRPAVELTDEQIFWAGLKHFLCDF